MFGRLHGLLCFQCKYICIFISIYIHEHICVCIYIHTYLCKQICVYIYIFVPSCNVRRRTLLNNHCLVCSKDGCPECVILSQLRTLGWDFNAARGPHVPGIDDKFFVYKRGHTNSLYLQCVLCLDEFGQRGLQSLAVNQSQAYYTLVRTARDLSDLPSDRRPAN